MRIACFYADLHPATKAALPPVAELVWTGADDGHYWRELMARWGGGDLVTIEQDVEIHDQVIPQFEACGSLWCTFPYVYDPALPGQLATGALGCAKFSAQCQRQFPDIAQRAADFAVANGLPPEPVWHSCDSYIRRALVVAGVEECRHSPLVTHHHWPVS
jgi:hypothetical protein